MKRLLIAGLLMLTATTARAAEPDKVATWVRENVAGLVEIYREFHQMPELSFEEAKTAAKLAKLWEAAGLEVTTGFGGHGIVGISKNGPGPIVMFRTDLDALPVVEQTGLKYASQVKVKDKTGKEVGVMHACGHDIHITTSVGLARYLLSHKNLWSGTVMFIGQPAEERVRGAAMMLDAGLFTKFPKPDYALALHVNAALPTGKIACKPGYLLANVDSVDITLKGRGGHGAYPHATIDPIVMAAHLILDLQSLVSRENNPTEPAVITVGSIHGGAKHNIISDSCHLQLTVRNYSPDVRKKLLAGIKRKANAVAASAGAPEPEVVVSDEDTPALFNDEKLTARLIPVFEQALGKQNVVPSELSMGGEDFSRYGIAGVPICMFWVGAVEGKRLAGLTRGDMPPPSLHSPLFYPDAKETLETALVAMSSAALDLLQPPKKAAEKP